MCLYALDHTENGFSLSNTRLFVKYILASHFRLDFFLNDTCKLDSKYVPKELDKIINFDHLIIDENHAIIYNSIFSLKKNVAILLKLKIDFERKIIQLFPIEIKCDNNQVSECSLVEELIAENNIEIADPLSIIKNTAECINFNEVFEQMISPKLNSLMDFMFYIWGLDDHFWDKNKLRDIGTSCWFKKLSNNTSKVTIHGILFNIPDSLILEYFESEDLDLNHELLSESSKKFLEDVNKSISEHSELFSMGFVPKFTWSSPTDAIWIKPNRSICCKTLEDLLILLKASTKVSEDIDRAKEREICNVLLLREYIPTLNEMFEFRVFIGGLTPYSEYKILGICQRHISYYFKELSENSQLRAKIKSCIMEFFLCSKRKLILEVIDIFNSMFIAFDIYISKYKDRLSVLIIDIQPLLYSSTLLFNIFELKLHLLKESKELDFDILRVVECNSEKNMIENNNLKGFVPEELLSVSNSDFYSNEVIDKLEWVEY